MTTISFKAEDDFKTVLDTLAERKGINTSAYIKLVLKQQMNGELVEITENGLTVAEELAILKSDKEDKAFGPFGNAKNLMKALKK